MNKQERNNQKMLTAISLSILVWGALLALGVYLFEADPTKAIFKAVIVFGMVSLFLGGWMLLLKSRKGQQAKEPENPADDQ